MTQQLATRDGGRPALANGILPGAGMMLRPDADITETNDKVVIVADLPGVSPEDVDVSLERRVLTISAQSKAPELEGFRQIHAENAAVGYERAFTLSDDIDADRIEASVSDGVLTLVLPKAEKAQSRRIDVKTA